MSNSTKQKEQLAAKNSPLTSNGKSVYSPFTQNELKMNKTNCLPWLTESGKLKSDKQIAELGKEWSAETWNNYLDYSIGIIKDEQLDFFPLVDSEVMYEGAELLKFLQANDDYSSLRFVINLVINKLPLGQSKIIKLYYWEEMDSIQIGKKLNISQSTVRVQKANAIKNLHELISTEIVKKIIQEKTKQKRRLRFFK